MIDLPDLVALLYRADWTQLSLSAGLARRVDRSAVEPLHAPSGRFPVGVDTDSPRWQETTSDLLVAPGGRFRLENARDVRPDLTVCDGESCWRLLHGWAERQDACLGDPALAKLLDPSWLLAWYVLEPAGTADDGRTTAGGRTAYRVMARWRPASQHRNQPDRIDLLVDAELGILLRLEASDHGRLMETSALESLIVDPDRVLDLTQFSPPPGTTASDPVSSLAEFGQLKGPFGQVVGTAADMTAAALGFAVRHGPRLVAATPGPPMPVPPPEDETTSFEPLSDYEIGLLHRTGLASQNFSAELRQWIDHEVMLGRARTLGSSMRQPFTGILGPDSLWDALGEQATGVGYRAARLRVAMPGRYRLDYQSGNWGSKLTVACDGERLQTLYRNRVVTGPAEPMDDEWAQLADPAWLLSSDWQLSPAGEITVAGRPGLLVWAKARRRPDRSVLYPTSWSVPGDGAMLDRVAVILDAELGILLRFVGYFGSRPVTCLELADVRPRSAADPAEFTAHVPPGTRVVEGSSPLAHLDLRRPVEAAKAAGVIGMAGAAIVSGWLQNRPGRRPGPGKEP